MKIETPNPSYIFFGRDSDDPNYDYSLDHKIVKETWIENVYRIHEYQFSPGGVFVDIGANLGAVSLYVDSFNAIRFNKNKKIKTYAIEPEPNNLTLLKNNILNNPTEKITVVEKAMSSTSRSVRISDRGGNSNVFDFSNYGSTEVDAITMQEFFDMYDIQEVDVMKIDIEGSEYDLIINTPTETLLKIKYLCLEFDRKTDGSFGIMVEKLSKYFGIVILGSPERGGYIYAERY